MKNIIVKNSITGNYWGGANSGFNATRDSAVAVDASELAVLRATFLNCEAETNVSEDVVTPVLVGYVEARIPFNGSVSSARFGSLLVGALRRHGHFPGPKAVAKLCDAVLASGRVVRITGPRGAWSYRLPSSAPVAKIVA